MRRTAFAVAALAGLSAALCAAPALAQREPVQRSEPVEAKEAKAARERDLAQLRARMEALRGELDSKESTRREARDALRDSERAISDANRELRALEAAGRAAQEALRDAETRRRSLAEALERQQAALGRMLAARYAAGPPDALRIALSGDDPNEAARRLYYLSQLSRAAARLISAFRADVAELERLSAATREQKAQIETLQAGARREREKIVSESRARKTLLERLAGDIRNNRREMRSLQADETRLARVVEEIARLLTARPGAGYAARPAPPRRRGTPVEGVGEPGGHDSPAGPFSLLRGKLSLPVRGELLGRFGSPQQEGGSSSKGVFIRAGEGQAVRAVAAGRVVYADWMRGFGNLLIVDHGEAYLSIYGNNESLLKQAGDAVAGGEAVATVGSTGGNPETGLYFELRHLGKAFDPLRWTKR